MFVRFGIDKQYDCTDLYRVQPIIFRFVATDSFYCFNLQGKNIPREIVYRLRVLGGGYLC